MSRGFDWLLARELAGQTDAYYDRAFTAWEKLLRTYEAELDRLGLTEA